MANSDEHVLIGRILRKRGNRGEIVIKPMTAERERFLSLRRIFIGFNVNELASFEIEKVWFHGRRTVMKLKGIDTISEAENMRGQNLYIPDAEKIDLPAGTYFHHDLIGMEVVDRSLGVLGNIVSIIETGGADILVVENDSRQIMIPAAKHYCREVDLESGCVRVIIPKELLTLNEV
ncbi:ribosome maturation factor RimM [Acidobacteriota bacterium]